MASTNDVIAIAVTATDGVIDAVTLKEVSMPKDSAIEPKRFHEIFGKFGYGMILVLLLSTVWTLILAVIQVRTVEVANALMKTTTYDQGEFWLLPAADVHVEEFSVIVLVLFAMGYLGLVALMIFPNRLSSLRHTKRQHPGVKPMTKKAKPIQPPHPTNKLSVLARLHHELLSPHGRLYQYYSALLDGPKLIFQTTTLVTYLHHGFPLFIIYIYTILLVLNWGIAAYRYQTRHPNRYYILTHLLPLLDMYFAVFSPLMVLLYAYFTFDFDHLEFQTRIDVLTPGSYDTTARFVANPAQINVFRTAFTYLHFYDVGSVLIKSVLNLLTLYKWKKMISHLLQMPQNKHESISSSNKTSIQNILLALVFFFTGIAILIYSFVSIQSTHSICRGYSQCMTPSYQWNINTNDCSCLVFLDQELSPKTYQEWIHPLDTTANLAALAKTGHLRMIQIINRAVPEFPLELMHCDHLEQLTLIYTQTMSLPEWMREFKHLEYFHFEQEATQRKLSILPLNLFDHTFKLRFLHLGSLIDLSVLPDLTHLDQLRYLSLTVLPSIHSLPDLTGLINLRTLTLSDLNQVETLPSIASLKMLKSFVLNGHQPTCCNGYVTKGVCDTTMCVCSPFQWSPENWKILDTIPVVSMCEPTLTVNDPTQETTDVACGGIKYKQCMFNGQPGICYNTRMMIITCDTTGQYEQLRRVQIQRGIPCDPTIEAWLGCQYH